MKVSVLRLGHRYIRDKRTTTHIALVARAFSADELILDTIDTHLKESIDKVTNEWGGAFEIKSIDNPIRFIKNFKGDKIHLTMYGLNIEDKIKDNIKNSKDDKLIIIGGKKVPSEIYSLVDYNIAIGNQPHSEIAALALFLDRLFSGEELLRKDFIGAKRKIIPKEKGKLVISTRPSQ